VVSHNSDAAFCSFKVAVAVKSRYEQLIAYVPFMESVTTSGFESSDPSSKLRLGKPVFRQKLGVSRDPVAIGLSDTNEPPPK
jgi:hypothetical protein